MEELRRKERGGRGLEGMGVGGEKKKTKQHIHACTAQALFEFYGNTKERVFQISLRLIEGQREQIWDINPAYGRRSK